MHMHMHVHMVHMHVHVHDTCTYLQEEPVFVAMSQGLLDLEQELVRLNELTGRLARFY